MSTAQPARTLLALTGLLIFSLWLPIAAITYLPGWHTLSCQWHERCADYDISNGDGAAQERITELRHFMQHRGTLSAFDWTRKERAHLAEVRTLLDRLLVLAMLGALVFLHADAATRARVALWSMLGVAACIAVLPFFTTFWREVFHPLLFDNNNWRNYPEDTSWSIMPRLYFKYTTALVIGSAVTLCALAFWRARRELRAGG
ncbi:MAG: DUF1461 domain-containing protein [Pseudomonadota bacterium]